MIFVFCCYFWLLGVAFVLCLCCVARFGGEIVLLAVDLCTCGYSCFDSGADSVPRAFVRMNNVNKHSNIMFFLILDCYHILMIWVFQICAWIFGIEWIFCWRFFITEIMVVIQSNITTFVSISMNWIWKKRKTIYTSKPLVEMIGIENYDKTMII